MNANPFIGEAEQEAHRRALSLLQDAGLEVMVGGAYAMFHYTGVVRWTKDLDIFLTRGQEASARDVLAAAGYRTEVREPMWLSKAWWGDAFIDLIYSSGNGIAVVDAEWVRHARLGEALGISTRIVPPEEMIWSKGFVQERERWDGADVNHLIRACGPSLDWKRLLRRFDDHWEILLAHLLLFSYTYPHDRDLVPRWVWRRLLARADASRAAPDVGGTKLCRGTLLSRIQYNHDVGHWGYQDARQVEVPGFMPEAAPAARAAAAGDEARAPSPLSLVAPEV